MSDPLNELLIIGPLVAKIQVADILDWATDRFTKVMYQSIHDECRYLDTRVFTLKELLKEDIPKKHCVVRYTHACGHHVCGTY